MHSLLNNLFFRYEATDMNIYRSALSACVIMGLPNVYDYIHKHRERLMEEKRQKILLSETARHGQHRTALPDVRKTKERMLNSIRCLQVYIRLRDKLLYRIHY